MPTIQIEAKVTSRDLLRAIEQLPAEEFRTFVDDVLGMQAQRQAPCLSVAESDLLMQVNEGLPQALASRYRELRDKLHQEILTPNEHDELLSLTDQIEQLEANRVNALVQLAGLRKTTLTQLMQDLGIRTPSHE